LQLISSRTIPEFEEQLLRGKFDFVYMNPYEIVLVQDYHQYIPLFRDISRDLQGIIVVRKDSPVQSIHDLDGQFVTFPSFNSES